MLVYQTTFVKGFLRVGCRCRIVFEMRLGVLTGGGDAPGLNPFLRALVRALGPSDTLLGFEDAFLGLLEDRFLVLTRENTRGLQRMGGTRLGSTNRVDPFDVDGVDRSSDVAANVARHGLDALIVVGGDGTLALAGRFQELHKIPVLGVPKTIDGDVAETDATLGFATALSVAVEALDRLEATAYSHHRMIALEVMGRSCGRLALHAGLAGGVDGILLPEFPFEMERVCELVGNRQKSARFSILSVAEGAREAGAAELRRPAHVAGGATPLGGIAEVVAAGVERATGVESRAVVLGHVLRGAPPVPEDRILAGRLAAAAVLAARNGVSGVVLVNRGEAVLPVPLSRVAGVTRRLTKDDETVRTARALGIPFAAAIDSESL